MTTQVRTRTDASTAGFLSVDLGPGVSAGFTGRAPAGAPAQLGAAGNLSHHRPHVPARLAVERSHLARRLGVEVDALHFMRQVHGRAVALVDEQTPRGAQLDDVDVLVTAVPGRALCVQVADCVPLLLASSEGPIAAVHAGRRGVAQGVVESALEALHQLGADPHTLTAAIGPAIGGCCYEVPEQLQRDVASAHPAAQATTTWGTPSLDLPAAVAASLRTAGVPTISASPGCTRCDPEGRWFSHRADPGTGRQVGVIVRTETAV